MGDPEAIQPIPKMSEVWRSTLKWQPNEVQQQQFQSLYAEILKGNQRLNLTRITEAEDFWEKHLWDSIAGLMYLDWFDSIELQKSIRAIDIGTGAGFPGIPVAIFSNQIEVTLLDSTRKKITFLAELINNLQLNNLKTFAARAEDFGRNKQRREFYDLALVRAVGKATVAAEYALPLLKIGGVAVLYRGRWQEEETKAVENAVSQLGGRLDRIESFTTPLTHSTRNCLYLRKVRPTSDRFPRQIGIPTQKPL
ncbi:MAG: 16S rRNA (guanine(527)-N(7))-methyltransferase RsmG [Prochloraceae cyanobacterium]